MYIFNMGALFFMSYMNQESGLKMKHFVSKTINSSFKIVHILQTHFISYFQAINSPNLAGIIE